MGVYFLRSSNCNKRRFEACREKRIIRCGKGKAKYIIIFLLLALAAVLIYQYLAVIQPSVNDMAMIKAEEMITDVINEEIQEHFSSEAITASELLIVRTDSDGYIDLVQSDTVAMNILAANLDKGIKEKYSEMESVEVQIPWGTILGSQILSASDLSLDVKVMPMTITGMEIFSEFETQGINQTKYKVFMEVESKIRILVPFSSETIHISNTMPIAEAVILGRVPDNYVQVPSNEVLDGLSVE